MASEPDSSPPTRAERFERLGFLILLFLQLIPVLTTTYFPSQDGPAHLENAAILRHWVSDHAHLSAWYQLNLSPIPNLLGHLILAGLMFVVSPLVAEKILLCLILILLPLATRYAIRAIDPKSSPLAFLVFPLLYNGLFQRGFYNFSLGLGLAILLIGYWLHHRREMTLPRLVVFAVITLLLYLAHIAAAIPALLAIALLAPFLIKQDIAGGVSARGAFISAIKTFVAILPIIILSVVFIRGNPHSAEVATTSRADLIHNLLVLDVLVVHQDLEVIYASLTSLVFVLVLIAAIVRFFRKGFSPYDMLLLLVALLLFIYLQSGTNYAEEHFIAERTVILLLLVGIVWFAGQNLHQQFTRFIALFAAVISLCFGTLNTITYHRINEAYAEYLSVASMIRSGATILPIAYDTHGHDRTTGKKLSKQTAVFVHTGSYLAATRNLINLDNYEAFVPHFPLSFHEDCNPKKIFFRIEKSTTQPADVDLEKFERAAGNNASNANSPLRKIDYVLLWYLPVDDIPPPATRRLLEQLQRNYNKVPLDSNNVLLYERRRE